MFSNVIAWFYKSLLGIAPSESAPGFEQIDLRPNFIRELGFVKGAMDTQKGRIAAEWVYDRDHFVYTVTIPEGISASLNGQPVFPGKNEFIIK